MAGYGLPHFSSVPGDDPVGWLIDGCEDLDPAIDERLPRSYYRLTEEGSRKPGALLQSARPDWRFAASGSFWVSQQAEVALFEALGKDQKHHRAAWFYANLPTLTTWPSGTPDLTTAACAVAASFVRSLCTVSWPSFQRIRTSNSGPARHVRLLRSHDQTSQAFRTPTASGLARSLPVRNRSSRAPLPVARG